MPILAIDKRARAHIDTLYTKTIKSIFGWPTNVSNKLIRLITGLPNSTILTQKAINNRINTEHRESYNTLHNVLNNKTITNEDISDIDNNYAAYKRKYANPAMLLDPPTRINTHNMLNALGPLWIIDHHNADAVRIETLMGRLIQAHRIRHSGYQKGYFSMFGAVWQMCSNTNFTKSRKVCLKSNNTLLAALMKNNNHYWRVIGLREYLKHNGWQIYTVDTLDVTAYQTFAQHVYTAASRLHITPRPANSDNDVTPHNLQAAQHGTTGNAITYVFEPSFLDFKAKNRLGCQLKLTLARYYQGCHTSLTSTICSHIEPWQQYPPSWLNASNMLMLTGLVQDQHRQLKHGKLSPGELPDGCDADECRRQAREHPTGDNRLDMDAHTTTHRLFLCHRRNSDLDADLSSIIKEANKIDKLRETDNGELFITRTLLHTRLRQKLVRHLTSAAFPSRL